MALMNKLGILLYNVGLFLTMGIFFLTMKNYNIDDFTNTREYSQNLEYAIYFAVGAYAFFAIMLTMTTLISRDRKKGPLYVILLLIFWFSWVPMPVFTYAASIFADLNEPYIRYGMTAFFALGSFIPMFALILLQHPGRSESDRIIKALKKELQQDAEESLPYCPICRYRVKKDWKLCPKCGSKFSD
ncbi:MAG: hypothetical protein ACMUIG_08315 [Thermoplasmatota archaeon]